MTAHEFSYAVGRAVGPHGDLTPGCLGNIASNPQLARVFLRHRADIAAKLPPAGKIPLVVPAENGFWLGYYHARRAELIAEHEGTEHEYTQTLD